MEVKSLTYLETLFLYGQNRKMCVRFNKKNVTHEHKKQTNTKILGRTKFVLFLSI